VFQTLREKLGCKEIWVTGAGRWRNPDDDLPKDFEANRAENYQALLCGIVVARDQMTDVLRWLSDVLPMSYAVDAMQQISAGASWSGAVNREVGVILGFTVAALAGGALTLRRRTR
jgi:hypothetical protein